MPGKQGSAGFQLIESLPRLGGGWGAHQRLLECADIPELTKVKLRAEHAKLDPFELKKTIERKLKKFFTVLGNLNREATKP